MPLSYQYYNFLENFIDENLRPMIKNKYVFIAKQYSDDRKTSFLANLPDHLTQVASQNAK